jgi:hypothetical protein
MATAKIQSGMAHCAGGAGSMSFIPGRLQAYSVMLLQSRQDYYYWGMGLEQLHNSLFKFLEKIKMNLLITLI